jgi:long-chain acyl-CoA synthetase
MVARLVEEARKAGQTGEGIKTIVYGGGPMYLADIRAALSVLGPRFVQIYGQGESPMTITALGRRWHEGAELQRLTTVGRAQSVVEVRVTGDRGEPLPAGSDGEIEVRGLTVMAGYWRDPEATAKSLRDGWLRTGDIGRLDADGFLTLTDRSKDVIISGGTNIYPREVEEVLLQHPAIQEASVIGAVDAEWGEVVVACIVTRSDVTDEALDAHCLSCIARFKRPKRYIRLAELPKNSYGKVLKTALREAVTAAAR